MLKNEQSARLRAIRDYLAGIGHAIGQVQAQEVLARALGFENKHVLAARLETVESSAPALKTTGAVTDQTTWLTPEGASVPVMALTQEPFSTEQMAQMDWEFDVVIPFSLDQLESIDQMNDYASMRLTGNEAALEDIGFNHVPDVCYGKGWVAYRVTGYVSQPEAFFDVESEAPFYASLQTLLNAIQSGNALWMRKDSHPAEPVQAQVANLLALQCLQRYAQAQGSDDSNDAVNEYLKETAVVLTSCATGEKAYVSTDALKYATEQTPGQWCLATSQCALVLGLQA